MALSASEQLTAESAMTQSGDIAGAVKSSQVYTTGSPALDPDTPSVVTSQEAEDATTQNQSDLQAQIDSMQQAAEDSAASQTTSTSTSTTDTSTSDYNAEMQSISDALQSQYDSYAGQLDTFSASLNEANQAYIEAIKASYARRMEQMETLNKSTYASQQLLGVRSGRQRYASEIQTSILSAEEAAGIQRLTDLETEMNQIVAEAEMANSAKQFELLDKKMSQFQSLQDQKLSIIQNMQSTALQQEQLLLQKAQDAREQARFEMEQKAVESFFSGGDIISLMKEIPSGETRTITDPNTGAVYSLEGMAQVEGAETKQWLVTDDLGNVRVVNFDPTANNGKGGITSISDAGDVGKSKSSGTSITIGAQQSGQLGDASAKLNAALGGDGYTNTDLYTELRTEFSIQNAGDTKVFDETFKHLLNPDDPNAKYLLSGEKSGLSESDKTTLRSFGIDEETIDMAEVAGLSLQELLGG